MKYTGVLAGTGLLLLAQTTRLVAEEQTWRVEAESAGVTRQGAVTIVNDAGASGGKAINIPTEGVPNWNVVSMGLPADMTPGRYEAVLRLQATNLADIGKALRVDVTADTNLLAYAAAYGYYLRGPAGYQTFAIPFEWADAGRRPALYMRWTSQAPATGTQTTEGKPTVRLDAIDIVRRGDLPAVRIRRVWPDRVRYLADQNGDITVTIEGLSSQVVTGTVQVRLTHDLEAAVPLAAQPFTVASGQTATVTFPFKNPGQPFGYVAQAVVSVGGKELDRKEEFFTVHDNPWAVATGAPDQENARYETPWWAVYYGIGATDPEIEAGALQARRQYTTCTEFFSWSPGECFDMAPDKPFWIRGNGGDLLRSKREIQRAVAALRRHGTACITYMAYQAMGERAIELLRERPEWFTYSRLTGDVTEFYNLNELTKRQAFWKGFDWAAYATEGNPDAPGWVASPEAWKRYGEFWRKPAEECRKLSIIGYFVPNYALPDVVDYCADQVIASVKMFGWDGLRWDCGHLNPGPIWGTFTPVVDFSGKPQARTPAELETTTVLNLKRLKARIRAQFPRFAIGSNFGSWDETHRYPLQTAELARDGGWLLDEFCYGYNAPQSPYHFWDAYYGIMADQGEHVMRRGGHYHPFAFNRNGGKYPVDGLYESIFRIAGKGHPNSVYFNSRTPFGNFAQFCVRFGQFVFDPAIRRMDKPEGLVAVTAPAPLWWDKTVGRLKQGNQEFLVVHLINPPVQKEAETDPMSRMPATVDGAQVSAVVPAGKHAVSAWALTAESWTTGEAPRTQAVPLKVNVAGGRATVTVPQVLCWKIVVYRFG